MNKTFKILKKELILIIILKSFLVYLITLLGLYEFKLFELQNGILSFFVLILIPLITLRIVKNKEIEFSLRNFISLGIFISIFSSLIRVFILNNLLTELIYNYLFISKRGQVMDTMTSLGRTQEFLKFTLIGIIFFVIIGVIIKIKKVSQKNI